MAKGLFVLSAVLLVCILAISEIEAGPPKICEKPSKTFSGKCENKKCDKQCKSWEKATHGACHKREAKEACFCYYDDCGKSKGGSPPPAGGSPPPPAGGDSPPPPAGGDSPPPAGGDSPPPAGGDAPPPPGAH